MFKHVIHGISISSIHDKRRVNANGESHVRILVVHQRAKKYYTTGKICTEDEWKRLPQAKAKDLLELRNEIQICFEIIKKHIVNLCSEDKFSLPNLDKSLSRSSGISLNQLLEAKMAELKKNKQIGTMQSYQTTLSNLCKYKSKKIPIENVTVDWLNNYEKYLSGDRSITTVSINMRNIRTIMNIALTNGYIKSDQYPFGKGRYEIQTVEGIKKAHGIEDIRKIKEFHCHDEDTMRFRDYWLFILNCNGINVADLIIAKFKHIDDGELVFIREKTKRTTKNIKYIRAVISDEMQIIIDRWGNKPHPDNYIFSSIEFTDDAEVNVARKRWFIKTFNQHLKMISIATGVKNITTYSARHSYATILKNQGVNIAYISESLGHSSLTTTQNYLDSFEKEERIKNAQIISNI